MKTFAKLLFFSVSAAIVSACTSKNDMKGFTLFKLSDKDNVKQIPMDSVFSDIQVIKLDNSPDAPLLGNIENICEDENSYLIQSDGIIYEYGKDGAFLRKIGTKGRGPGEYLYLNGIQAYGDSLYIFDTGSQNLLTYNRERKLTSVRKPEAEEENTYLSSFFLNGADILFYTTSSSPRQEIFKYNHANGKLTAVSRKTQDLTEHLIIGGCHFFGDRTHPYIYNAFNDTVFVLNNDRLVPKFLIENVQYRLGHLTPDNMEQALSKKYTMMFRTASAGDWLILSYAFSPSINEGPAYYIGLYNMKTEEYLQNVEFTSEQDGTTIIDAHEALYEGRNHNSLLSIKPLSDTGEEYGIIIYTAGNK